MANVNLYEHHLQNMADALRVRTSQPSKTYTVAEMVTEVEKIYTAQSGNTDALEDGLVDGSIVNIEVEGIGTIKWHLRGYEFLESISFPDLTELAVRWDEDTQKYESSVFYIRDNPVLTSVNFPNLENRCLYYENSNMKWYSGISFANCDSLKRVSFPKLLVVPNFHDMASLEVVDMGNALVFNGDNHFGQSWAYNFNDCPNLKALILRGPEVATFMYTNGSASNSLKYCALVTNEDAYIYVPEALLSEYKTKYPVYKYRAIELYPDVCGEVS